MQKVWEIFENFNEYVFAYDIDNHDIIYMNKKAREKFGYSSVEDVKKDKCYKLMHDFQMPCRDCNAESLTPYNYTVSMQYDSDTNSNIIYKDTLIEDNGRRIKLRIAIFTNEYQNHQFTLPNYEVEVNKGLRISLKEATPDKSLKTLIEYIGRLFFAGRVYIFEKNSNDDDDNTYKWCSYNDTLLNNTPQNNSQEFCSFIYKKIFNKENIVIKNIADIKQSDKSFYDILKQRNVFSSIIIPLYSDGKIIGFFGIDNLSDTKYINYAHDVLQIMGHFIVALIERRNLVKKLEKMSFTDQLTNLGNRYALQKFIISNLKSYENVGVIFCDITGLKMINDQHGHEAGDRYIVNACECLLNVFGEFELFRIGGDELLVICPEITQSMLNDKVYLLKKCLDENSVTMAIGSVWKSGEFNIDEAMNEAEKIMYQDKSDYYKTKGIDRRKR